MSRYMCDGLHSGNAVSHIIEVVLRRARLVLDRRPCAVSKVQFRPREIYFCLADRCAPGKLYIIQ